MTIELPPMLTADDCALGRQLFDRLTIAFWAYLAALVFVYLAHLMRWERVALILVVVALIATIAFLILLGRLAGLLKKSLIVYVGGTIIMGPIGVVIMYVFIKGDAARAGLLSRPRSQS